MVAVAAGQSWQKTWEKKDEKPSNIRAKSENLYILHLPLSLLRSVSLSPPSSHSVSLHETERPMSEKGEFIWAYMP